MGGRASRQKGKRGERALATELREAFPEFADDIRRGWQCREGDDEPDVMGVPGYHFEHKALKKFNTAPLDQAIRDCKDRGIPIAVIRVDRKKPVAMIEWSELLKMLRRLKDVGADILCEGSGFKDVRRDPPRKWRVRVRASRKRTGVLRAPKQ